MTSLQRPALSVTLRPRDLVRTATLDDPFWRPILVFGQEPCGTFAKSCGSSVLPVLSNGVKLWRIAWTSVKDPFGTLAKKEPRGSFAKEQRRTFVESRGNSSEPLGTYVDKKKNALFIFLELLYRAYRGVSLSLICFLKFLGSSYPANWILSPFHYLLNSFFTPSLA